MTQLRFSSRKLVWPLAYILALIVLFQFDYSSRSDDSIFYNRIANQLAQKPFSQIIAPKWENNFYGNPPQDYIRDHLVGHPLLGALLIKAGFSSRHALHSIQLGFLLLSIHLLVLIAKEFVSTRKATIIYWSLLIVPIAFTYRIRANHEQGMMFFVLLGILAGLRLRQSNWCFLLAVVSGIGVFLIKGFPAVVMPGLIAIVYFMKNPPEKRYLFKMASVIVAGYIGLFLTAIFYEMFFRQTTGLPFFSEYWHVQIASRSLNIENEWPWLIQKFLNFSYYFRSSLYYAMPWSFIVVMVLWKKRPEFSFSTVLKNWHTLSLSHPVKLPLVLTVSALLFILPFSYSSRTASRFIFPSLYLVGASCVIFLVLYSKRIQKIHDQILKWGVLRFSALIWLMFHILHLVVFYIKTGGVGEI